MAGIGSVRRDDKVTEPVFVEDELVKSEVLVGQIGRPRWKGRWPRVYISWISRWGRASRLAQGGSWRTCRKGHSGKATRSHQANQQTSQ